MHRNPVSRAKNQQLSKEIYKPHMLDQSFARILNYSNRKMDVKVARIIASIR